MASEQRPAKRNLALIIQFLVGRFLGYLAFGLVFGALGEKMGQLEIALAINISLILLSILMLFYLFGLLKKKETTCLSQKFQSRNATLMGFLLGINVCPPFLLSLAYVFSLQSLWKSAIYFILFFLASSVFFLPMIAVGFLGKQKEFRSVARWSGILSACIFLGYGCYSIVKLN